MRAQPTAFSIAMALVGLLVGVSHAQEAPDHPMMSDGYFIAGGVLWADSDVTANLNTGRVGVGTFIDFEDDLGLDETDLIGMATFRMRLSKRWQLEAEYFNLDRDNQKQVERTLDWGNLNIPLNVDVKGAFEIQDIRVGVGYSIFRTKDKEIGLGLGAHVADFEASLATASFGSQRASESAPLPFFTFYARVALSERWLLSVRVDRLSLDTGDIDGSIFSSGTDIVYQPWRHFGIGLGYRDIDFQVTSTSEQWRGKAHIQESGPFLFLATTF